MTKHSGSCLCGKVAFEIMGDFESFYLCHCSRCRKDTGSAHASNLFSTSATLNWLTGAEEVKTFTLPETRHSRSFCTTCGSALPSAQMSGKLLVVPAGSLDTDVKIKPACHISMADKAQWDDELEKIPTTKGLPS